jgi:hypothetical protein
LAPEFDAIQLIIPLAQEQFHYRVHHVTGHQKDTNLTWEAQLNNKCNKLAILAYSLTVAPTTHRHPGASATLHIQKKEVTSSIATALRHAATTQDLRE